MTAANTDSVQPFFWDNIRDTTMDRYLYQRENAFIRRVLGVSAQPRRLQDVGCGSGRMTLPLHDAGHDVVGLDNDAGALAAFQHRSNAVPLIMGDAQWLPFADGRFDCVVAIQILQYVDHHQFLQECNGVSSNGGLLIFESLNRRNYKRVLRRLVGCVADLGPSYNLSYGEILQATADHGFDIQAVSGYNWVPFDQFSNSALMGVAALVEKTLRLDRCYSISPWILVAARKRV